MTPLTGSDRTVVRIVRMLLVLYPAPVRLEHGPEILAAATAEWQRGPGAAGFFVWLFADILRARADERRALRSTTPLPSPRRPKRGALMDNFLRDLQHSFRALLRRPGFAATAVVTLALGIGATTAVFSVVETVLLRPLPYAEAERLVSLSHGVPKIASGEWGLSRAGYFYFREHADTLEDLGAYREVSRVLTGVGDPERLRGATITWTLISTLGVTPEIGRPFTLDDDLPGAPPVVLISNGLWRRAFGEDPEMLGRYIELEGRRVEVVGVMAPSFRFPSARADFWVPMQFDPQARPVNQHIFPGVARLAPDVTPEQASTELNALVGRFAEEMPTAYGNGFVERSGFHAVVRTLLDAKVGNVRALLFIVLGAAALVIVIAIANVANLFVLRSEARRTELAVRSALGAGGGMLLWYALSEALLLAGAGGLLGGLIAWGGVQALVRAAPPALPRLEEIGLDPAVLGVTFVIVLLVALLLGAVGAVRGGVALTESLKQGRGASADRGRLRLRAALVVTQMAMALVLLAGAGLLFRSFMNLRAVDPGFSAEDVLTFQLSVPFSDYPENEQVLTFYQQVIDRVGSLPGVEAAGLVTGVPLASRPWENANDIADLPDGSEIRALIDTKFAGPGYFEVMHMRLVEGRTFERGDMEAGSEGVVVTRSLAELYWPGESAIGRRARPLMTDFPWHTVVGVIEDVRTEALTMDVEPVLYFPYTDVIHERSFTVAVRSKVPPGDLLAAIRGQVAELDPDVPLASIATMEEVVAEHMSRTTFMLALLAAASGVALVLGIVGVYGVISYAVSRRHFEIGIRMALGARASQVALLVFGQTMTLALAGIVVGLALAVVSTRWMEFLLFETAPTDPVTLGAVALGLATVAALAGLLPARRATRVDAVVALRRE